MEKNQLTTQAILKKLFVDRIYVLRNQLFHGYYDFDGLRLGKNTKNPVSAGVARVVRRGGSFLGVGPRRRIGGR